jgi:hypothetical protein
MGYVNRLLIMNVMGYVCLSVCVSPCVCVCVFLLLVVLIIVCVYIFRVHIEY